MKTFKLFLESTYKAQDGESEIVHHVSPHNFNEFKPLSHFGSHEAARDIGRQIKSDTENFTQDGFGYKKPEDGKLKYYSARIKLGNVAHVSDTQEDHIPAISHELHTNGHISKEDHEHIKGNPTKENLLHILKKNNINTISYNNEFEGNKPSKSYMITHHSQVRVLKKGNLDISDKRKEPDGNY